MAHRLCRQLHRGREDIDSLRGRGCQCPALWGSIQLIERGVLEDALALHVDDLQIDWTRRGQPLEAGMLGSAAEPPPSQCLQAGLTATTVSLLETLSSSLLLLRLALWRHVLEIAA